jgi:predicted RNA methylase
MKSKAITNLFGEPLSDEIESRVVKNKTLTFKKRSKATKEYHYIPINNIKNKKATKLFLNEMLGLLKSGYPVDQILYALGQELTAGKQLPDFHQKSKSNLQITIPGKVREEHDLIGDCYQYLTNKHERLKRGTFYTTEKIVECIIKDIDISDSTSVFDPACGSGNMILNSKVKKPEQVHGMDLDPLAVMCCQFNYYLKFGADAPDPDIKCGDFQEFVKSHDGDLKFDVVLCNPPYGTEMKMDGDVLSEVKSSDSLEFFVEHASKLANTSAFVLPETVVNIEKHKNLRNWILNKKKLAEVKSFGAGIRATLHRIVSLTLNNENNNNYLFDGKKVDYEISKNLLDSKFRPIDHEDMDFINKIYSVPHQALGKCKHVTGLVTGDDDRFLLDEPTAGAYPIITGKSIKPYKIENVKYIKYDDVKHLLAYDPGYDMFNVKEKLIYHTISMTLNFAIDTDSRLTTNNANFFIVEGFPIRAKCMMAILNSKVYNRLNKLLFGDKTNRVKNIKLLPIPILNEEQQIQMERLVDSERYDEIEMMLAEIFHI